MYRSIRSCFAIAVFAAGVATPVFAADPSSSSNIVLAEQARAIIKGCLLNPSAKPSSMSSQVPAATSPGVSMAAVVGPYSKAVTDCIRDKGLNVGMLIVSSPSNQDNTPPTVINPH